MKWTQQELEKMRTVDIREMNRDEITDIRDIVIDTSQSLEQRQEQFLAQTNNPYVFRIGDYLVKMEYTKDGSSLQEVVAGYLQWMAELR